MRARSAFTKYQYTDLSSDLAKENWTSFPLRKLGMLKGWSDGGACPQTVSVLSSIEQHLFPAEDVFFSKLRPGAALPAHTDKFNIRLTCHLGLIIPPDCGLRVANETRTWQEGKCLFFDHAYDHTAWNHSDRDRVILLFGIWNPQLTEIEVKVLRQLVSLAARFGLMLGS